MPRHGSEFPGCEGGVEDLLINSAVVRRHVEPSREHDNPKS